MKPILFNTQMIQAILENRKTVTRRVVKDSRGKTPGYYGRDKFYQLVDKLNNDMRPYAGFYKDSDVFFMDEEKHIDAIYFKQPYQVGDILYVRETWKQYQKRYGCGIATIYGYKADADNSSNPSEFYDGKWKPSIHMPKVAARIFLKVTAVRVERLQNMKLDDVRKEGANRCRKNDCNKYGHCEKTTTWLECFGELWNSTIPKKNSSDMYSYGWSNNPWVWVIEFEQISKGEAYECEGHSI